VSLFDHDLLRVDFAVDRKLVGGAVRRRQIAGIGDTDIEAAGNW